MNQSYFLAVKGKRQCRYPGKEHLKTPRGTGKEKHKSTLYFKSKAPIAFSQRKHPGWLSQTVTSTLNLADGWIFLCHPLKDDLTTIWSLFSLKHREVYQKQLGMVPAPAPPMQIPTTSSVHLPHFNSQSFRGRNVASDWTNKPGKTDYPQVIF